MIIMYGYRIKFLRDGGMGVQVCRNCGHRVQHTLCRQINQGTLFTLPIISFTKSRGVMCENCGELQPMNRQEYKEAKNQCQLLNG